MQSQLLVEYPKALMIQPIHHVVLVALLSLAPAAASARPAQQAPAAAEVSLSGRLATVEPAARRVTIVVEGDEELTELIVDEDGELRHQDQPVSLSDLVTLVGSRVTVRCELRNGTRVAYAITVEG
jgi:hypothetical protein